MSKPDPIKAIRVAAADVIEEQRAAYQHVVESREKAYKEIMRLEARLREIYDHPDASQGIRSIIEATLGL